jgi:hypothetical protein
MFCSDFNQNMRQKLDDCKAAQTVEISTIRNQFARASNQAASAHAQKTSELVSQNEACMQRYSKTPNLTSFHLPALTISSILELCNCSSCVKLCKKEIFRSILAAA